MKAFFLALLLGGALCNVVYVDNADGSDSNAGTETAPYETMERALQHADVDVVRVVANRRRNGRDIPYVGKMNRNLVHDLRNRSLTIESTSLSQRAVFALKYKGRFLEIRNTVKARNYTPTVTVTGLEIFNGRVSGAGENGGAFLVQNASLVLDDVRIENCMSEKGNGGAVAMIDQIVSDDQRFVLDRHWLQLTDVFFDSNWALKGGAIYGCGSTRQYYNLRINGTNNKFVQNGAVNGGAVALTDKAYLDMYRSSFSENTASENGGAVHVEGYSRGMFKQSYFVENEANLGNGGAIHVVSDQGGVILDECRLCLNTAGAVGGALYNEEPLNVVLRTGKTIFACNKDMNGRQNSSQLRVGPNGANYMFWKGYVDFPGNDGNGNPMSSSSSSPSGGGDNGRKPRSECDVCLQDGRYEAMLQERATGIACTAVIASTGADATGCGSVGTPCATMDYAINTLGCCFLEFLPNDIISGPGNRGIVPPFPITLSCEDKINGCNEVIFDAQNADFHLLFTPVAEYAIPIATPVINHPDFFIVQENLGAVFVNANAQSPSNPSALGGAINIVGTPGMPTFLTGFRLRGCYDNVAVQGACFYGSYYGIDYGISVDYAINNQASQTGGLFRSAFVALHPDARSGTGETFYGMGMNVLSKAEQAGAVFHYSDSLNWGQIAEIRDATSYAPRITGLSPTVGGSYYSSGVYPDIGTTTVQNFARGSITVIGGVSGTLGTTLTTPIGGVHQMTGTADRTISLPFDTYQFTQYFRVNVGNGLCYGDDDGVKCGMDNHDRMYADDEDVTFGTLFADLFDTGHPVANIRDPVATVDFNIIRSECDGNMCVNQNTCAFNELCEKSPTDGKFRLMNPATGGAVEDFWYYDEQNDGIVDYYKNLVPHPDAFQCATSILLLIDEQMVNFDNFRQAWENTVCSIWGNFPITTRYSSFNSNSRVSTVSGYIPWDMVRNAETVDNAVFAQESHKRLIRELQAQPFASFADWSVVLREAQSQHDDYSAAPTVVFFVTSTGNSGSMIDLNTAKVLWEANGLTRFQGLLVPDANTPGNINLAMNTLFTGPGWIQAASGSVADIEAAITSLVNADALYCDFSNPSTGCTSLQTDESLCDRDGVECTVGGFNCTTMACSDTIKAKHYLCNIGNFQSCGGRRMGPDCPVTCSILGCGINEYFAREIVAMPPGPYYTNSGSLFRFFAPFGVNDDMNVRQTYEFDYYEYNATQYYLDNDDVEPVFGFQDKTENIDQPEYPGNSQTCWCAAIQGDFFGSNMFLDEVCQNYGRSCNIDLDLGGNYYPYQAEPPGSSTCRKLDVPLGWEYCGTQELVPPFQEITPDLFNIYRNSASFNPIVEIGVTLDIRENGIYDYVCDAPTLGNGVEENDTLCNMGEPSDMCRVYTCDEDFYSYLVSFPMFGNDCLLTGTQNDGQVCARYKCEDAVCLNGDCVTPALNQIIGELFRNDTVECFIDELEGSEFITEADLECRNYTACNPNFLLDCLPEVLPFVNKTCGTKTSCQAPGRCNEEGFCAVDPFVQPGVQPDYDCSKEDPEIEHAACREYLCDPYQYSGTNIVPPYDVFVGNGCWYNYRPAGTPCPYFDAPCAKGCCNAVGQCVPSGQEDLSFCPSYPCMDNVCNAATPEKHLSGCPIEGAFGFFLADGMACTATPNTSPSTCDSASTCSNGFCLENFDDSFCDDMDMTTVDICEPTLSNTADGCLNCLPTPPCDDMDAYGITFDDRENGFGYCVGTPEGQYTLSGGRTTCFYPGECAFHDTDETTFDNVCSWKWDSDVPCHPDPCADVKPGFCRGLNQCEVCGDSVLDVCQTPKSDCVKRIGILLPESTPDEKKQLVFILQEIFETSYHNQLVAITIAYMSEYGSHTACPYIELSNSANDDSMERLLQCLYDIPLDINSGTPVVAPRNNYAHALARWYNTPAPPNQILLFDNFVSFTGPVASNTGPFGIYNQPDIAEFSNLLRTIGTEINVVWFRLTNQPPSPSLTTYRITERAKTFWRLHTGNVPNVDGIYGQDLLAALGKNEIEAAASFFLVDQNSAVLSAGCGVVDVPCSTTSVDYMTCSCTVTADAMQNGNVCGPSVPNFPSCATGQCLAGVCDTSAPVLDNSACPTNTGCALWSCDPFTPPMGTVPDNDGCVSQIDNMACNTGNVCEMASCNCDGTCEITPVTDGLPCGADNACTIDLCIGGVCVTQNKPISTPCNELGFQCTQGFCDEGGNCVADFQHWLCEISDCLTGSCTANAMSDPVTGCSSVQPDGTSCAPAGQCFDAATCQGGICVPDPMGNFNNSACQTDPLDDCVASATCTGANDFTELVTVFDKGYDPDNPVYRFSDQNLNLFVVYDEKIVTADTQRGFGQASITLPQGDDLLIAIEFEREATFKPAEWRFKRVVTIPITLITSTPPRQAPLSLAMETIVTSDLVRWVVIAVDYATSNLGVQDTFLVFFKEDMSGDLIYDHEIAVVGSTDFFITPYPLTNQLYLASNINFVSTLNPPTVCDRIAVADYDTMSGLWSFTDYSPPTFGGSCTTMFNQLLAEQRVAPLVRLSFDFFKVTEGGLSATSLPTPSSSLLEGKITVYEIGAGAPTGVGVTILANSIPGFLIHPNERIHTPLTATVEADQTLLVFTEYDISDLILPFNALDDLDTSQCARMLVLNVLSWDGVNLALEQKLEMLQLTQMITLGCQYRQELGFDFSWRVAAVDFQPGSILVSISMESDNDFQFPSEQIDELFPMLAFTEFYIKTPNDPGYHYVTRFQPLANGNLYDRFLAVLDSYYAYQSPDALDVLQGRIVRTSVTNDEKFAYIMVGGSEQGIGQDIAPIIDFSVNRWFQGGNQIYVYCINPEGCSDGCEYTFQPDNTPCTYLPTITCLEEPYCFNGDCVPAAPQMQTKETNSLPCAPLSFNNQTFDQNVCGGAICAHTVGCLYRQGFNGQSCLSSGASCDVGMCMDGVCNNTMPSQAVCDFFNPVVGGCAITFCNSSDPLADPVTGCVTTMMSNNPYEICPSSLDSVTCTVEQCLPDGSCQITPRDFVCDDSDPCTIDSCDPSDMAADMTTGCVNMAIGGTGAVCVTDAGCTDPSTTCTEEYCCGGQCLDVMTPGDVNTMCQISNFAAPGETLECTDCDVCNTDGICNDGENSVTCPMDCMACVDNGCCEPFEDDACADCASVVCTGNGVCENDENRHNCAVDCQDCDSDGMCEVFENCACSDCTDPCSMPDDGVCSMNENAAVCDPDSNCDCAPSVCDYDGFCNFYENEQCDDCRSDKCTPNQKCEQDENAHNCADCVGCTDNGMCEEGENSSCPDCQRMLTGGV